MYKWEVLSWRGGGGGEAEGGGGALGPSVRQSYIRVRK